MSKREFSKIFLTRLEGENILVAESIDSKKQVGKISKDIEKPPFDFLLAVCPNEELKGLLRYFRERYQEKNIVRSVIREEKEREKFYGKILYK